MIVGFLQRILRQVTAYAMLCSVQTYINYVSAMTG